MKGSAKCSMGSYGGNRHLVGWGSQGEGKLGQKDEQACWCQRGRAFWMEGRIWVARVCVRGVARGVSGVSGQESGMKREKAGFLKYVGPVGLRSLGIILGWGSPCCVWGPGQVGVWLLRQNHTGVCACIGLCVYAWVCVYVHGYVHAWMRTCVRVEGRAAAGVQTGVDRNWAATVVWEMPAGEREMWVHSASKGATEEIVSGEMAGGHGGWRGSQVTSGAVRVCRTFLILDLSSLASVSKSWDPKSQQVSSPVWGSMRVRRTRMGRKTRRPWKQLQGGSFLHSVRDREGLEELNGPYNPTVWP